jgi:hypothetical protein
MIASRTMSRHSSEGPQRAFVILSRSTGMCLTIKWRSPEAVLGFAAGPSISRQGVVRGWHRREPAREVARASEWAPTTSALSPVSSLPSTRARPMRSKQDSAERSGKRFDQTREAPSEQADTWLGNAGRRGRFRAARPSASSALTTKGNQMAYTAFRQSAQQTAIERTTGPRGYAVVENSNE